MRARALLVAAQDELRRSPPLGPHDRRDVYASLEELLRELASSPHHAHQVGRLMSAACEMHTAAADEAEQCRLLELDNRSGT